MISRTQFDIPNLIAHCSTLDFDELFIYCSNEDEWTEKLWSKLYNEKTWEFDVLDKYRKFIKTLLVLLHLGLNNNSLQNEEFMSLRPIFESLVKKKQMDAEILVLF